VLTGLLMLGILATGCGRAKPLGTVRGTVQFRGEPVTRGLVMLYSAELGYGNRRGSNADGTFVVDGLPYGTYQLGVSPPRVIRDFGGNSDATRRTEEVDNIPNRYRNPAKSGFSCEVAGPIAAVELHMQ